MSSASPSIDVKLVVLGDAGVGKTCIVLRYTQGTFSADTQHTVGAFFLTKKMVMDNCRVKLQIWDTAGQERFRGMAPMYYRGAAAAVLVYDITQRESFKRVRGWVEELRQNIEEETVLAITGNKADLASMRAVSWREAQEYADSVGALLTETSAKEDTGIDDMFKEIARKLIKQQETRTQSNLNTREAPPGTEGARVSVVGAAENKTKCCFSTQCPPLSSPLCTRTVLVFLSCVCVHASRARGEGRRRGRG
eukprot:TRINITY_DN4692_c0_g1_i1.p1 TRINITY_DN4692_c0_g1~~TRINITY_DN4692_c0_g1_i1.p1  ORF type:complete len:279 (+),score=56.28 TRINITY_DN4692_c0_g1_i1:87-839(+)